MKYPRGSPNYGIPPPPVRTTIGVHEAVAPALVDFTDDYQEASAIRRAEIARRAEQPRKSYKARKAKAPDPDSVAAMLAVDYAALGVYPDMLGYEADFLKIIAQWRPVLVDAA